MFGRFSLSAVCFLVLVAIAIATSGALAQGSPDVFVTPIPHAPFTGVINVERSIVRGDGSGSIINLKTMRQIGRDSQGRIYNESRTLVPMSSRKTPKVVSVHLYDPQTRVSIMLNPQERTFSTRTVNHPPATVPLALLYASPTGNTLPQNEFTKEEDLGVREMEGETVHGVREIQTIPAESSDTGKEIVIIDEYWYSDELRINLGITHRDPRTGSVTMTVTQIARTEPDPAMFEIPDEYRAPRGRRGTE
jgi:hypothetical protein